MYTKSEQGRERLTGIMSAAGAYLLWGILPVYWKQLTQVPAYEILAHRIIWSFFFMFAVILATRSFRVFLTETVQLGRNPRKLAGLIIASVLISANWLIYIWAVNENRVVETSLGYYINPLVNVLLGIIVLKEKLSLWQGVSCGLAATGVLIMAVNFGAVPWVSLSLAFTFAFYGMCKKILGLSAITSTTLETLVVSPVAAAYLLILARHGSGAFGFTGQTTTWLLVGAGAVTATPLLLFAGGANRLSLSLLGFTQYLSPTITLVIGVVIYHEPFTQVHMLAFGFIWLALAVFSLAKTRIFINAAAYFTDRRKSHGNRPEKA